MNTSKDVEEFTAKSKRAMDKLQAEKELRDGVSKCQKLTESEAEGMVTKATITCTGQEDTVVEGDCIIVIGLTETKGRKESFETNLSIVGNFTLNRALGMVPSLRKAQEQLIHQTVNTFGKEAFESILALSMEDGER